MYHHNPDSLAEVWRNAVWVGKGTRIREHRQAWKACTPWRSLCRGWRVARRSGRRRFVVFNLVYDAGVLTGLLRSHRAPQRHWR